MRRRIHPQFFRKLAAIAAANSLPDDADVSPLRYLEESDFVEIERACGRKGTPALADALHKAVNFYVAANTSDLAIIESPDDRDLIQGLFNLQEAIDRLLGLLDPNDHKREIEAVVWGMLETAHVIDDAQLRFSMFMTVADNLKIMRQATMELLRRRTRHPGGQEKSDRYLQDLGEALRAIWVDDSHWVKNRNRKGEEFKRHREFTVNKGKDAASARFVRAVITRVDPGQAGAVTALCEMLGGREN